MKIYNGLNGKFNVYEPTRRETCLRRTIHFFEDHEVWRIGDSADKVSRGIRDSSGRSTNLNP